MQGLCASRPNNNSYLCNFVGVLLYETYLGGSLADDNHGEI